MGLGNGRVPVFASLAAFNAAAHLRDYGQRCDHVETAWSMSGWARPCSHPSTRSGPPSGRCGAGRAIHGIPDDQAQDHHRSNGRSVAPACWWAPPRWVKVQPPENHRLCECLHALFLRGRRGLVVVASPGVASGASGRSWSQKSVSSAGARQTSAPLQFYYALPRGAHLTGKA